MRNLLFLFIIFLSCSKSESEKTKKVCYYCEFGLGPNGQIYSPKDTCFDFSAFPTDDDVAKYQFQDKDGNDMNGICKKK